MESQSVFTVTVLLMPIPNLSADTPTDFESSDTALHESEPQTDMKQQTLDIRLGDNDTRE
ncbi:MAG: hypothetical protein ACU84Q_08500 [Gammaproteobacteria bacterium]